ncbi:terminase small subunit [Hazenella sp. IB182357]|uniref:Terminase small subunit n=1 Tax=Polycladospora coralii TaxID=2771432 RepID=A0A926NBZ2_9BACL|nr:terminase small subunit [Polycladospora coralii]MBD1373762.1 terminase small subunit [Polycladospora coralii]
MTKLTPKQKTFVNEYIVDLNATKAAIRAGYSEKSARFSGHENLTKPNIQAAIQKALDKREARTEVTADMVLKQWAKIAFADIKDVVTWEHEDVMIKRDKKTGEPVMENLLTIDLKPSDEVDGTILSEVSETIMKDGRKVTVKMNDRMRALEMLGRHLGMFNDKMNLEADMSININVKGSKNEH